MSLNCLYYRAILPENPFSAFTPTLYWVKNKNGNLSVSTCQLAI
nr:MAG TPA: hypothetical protein [Caudoviricetes sp.]